MLEREQKHASLQSPARVFALSPSASSTLSSESFSSEQRRDLNLSFSNEEEKEGEEEEEEECLTRSVEETRAQSAAEEEEEENSHARGSKSESKKSLFNEHCARAVDEREVFSTRLSTVKQVLQEECKKARELARASQERVTVLSECVEYQKSEFEDQLESLREEIRKVKECCGIKEDEYDHEEDEAVLEARKRKRFRFVKEELDRIAMEVGYEDAVMLARSVSSSQAVKFSSLSEAYARKLRGFATMTRSAKAKAVALTALSLFAFYVLLQVIFWMVIVSMVLYDDATLKNSVSSSALTNFWSRAIPWDVIGLASL